MRKVMPGCFLGWNGVGCLVGAAGLGGEAGYRGEAPREVGGKKGPRGVPGMLAKRFWGFLDVADWRGKMILPAANDLETESGVQLCPKGERGELCGDCGP